MKKISLLLIFAFLLAANINFAQEYVNTKKANETKIVNSYIELVSLNYEPNTTSNIVFRHVYNSTDGNWIKGVSIQFPDGVTVNSATSCLEAEGTLTYNGETGNGALATWGDTEVGTGMGELNLTGEFSVNVTIAEDFAGEMTFIWKIIGDGFGDEPHFNEGTLNLMQPVNNDLGIQKITDFPTNIIREGETYSIMLRVYNYGLITQVDKEISLDIDGTTYSEVLSSVEPGEYQSVIFSGLIAQAGKHTHTISVPEDENSTNDNTIVLDLVFAPNNYNAFEFEDDAFMQIWTMTPNFKVRAEGAYGSYMEKYLASYFDESNIGTYTDTIKTKETIHITGNSTNEFMSFYVRGFTMGVKPNSLKVIYSLDNKNWEELQTIDYSDDYELVYINLASALSEGYYYIGLEAINTTASSAPPGYSIDRDIYSDIFTSSQYIDNLIIPESESVSVIESDINFNIYPNPVKDKLFVEVDKNYTLQIVDLSGTVIDSKNLNIGKNTINTENKGVYILKFISDNNIFNSKIVVE